MTIRFIEESCELEGAKISVAVVSLENAAIVLVTNKKNEYRVGNIALAMPIRAGTGETSPSILALFGSGSGLLAKAVAGKISSKMGKAVLSMVGLKEDDLGAVSTILKVTEGILAKIQAS